MTARKKKYTKPKRRGPKLKRGRKPVNWRTIIPKLRTAAAWGCSVTEMALHAGVGKTTLYDYLQENEELAEELERLRDKPVIKARKTVYDRIEESYQNAMDFLRRKRKEEFSTREEHVVDATHTITGMRVIDDDEEISGENHN